MPLYPNLTPEIAGGYRIDDALFTRLWGAGKATIATLADIRIAEVSSEKSCIAIRFRAPYACTVDTLRTYLTGVGGLYAGGTGGTMRARIFPDDGSELTPNMGGTAVATGTLVLTLVAGVFSGGQTAYSSITFSSGARTLTAGAIYYIVIDNTDATPATNWCGVNSIANLISQEPPLLFTRYSDAGVLFGTTSGGYSGTISWAQFTNDGNASNGLRYAPIYQIKTTDNRYFGQGNIQTGEVITGGGADRTYDVTNAAPIRYRITPLAAKTITGLSIMTAASVAGDLKWEMKQGSTVLAQGTITQSPANHSILSHNGLTADNYTWYHVETAAFALSAGTTYDLVLTPQGSSVWHFSADVYAGEYSDPVRPTEFQAQVFQSGAYVNANPTDHNTPGTDTHWRIILHTNTVTTVPGLQMTTRRLQRAAATVVRAAPTGSKAAALLNFAQATVTATHFVEIYDSTGVKLRVNMAAGAPQVQSGRLVFNLDYPSLATLSTYVATADSRCRIVSPTGAGLQGTIGLAGTGRQFTLSNNLSTGKGVALSISLTTPAGIDGGTPPPLPHGNGVWFFKVDLFTSEVSSTLRGDAVTRLQDAFNRGLNNVYLECGWPNPAQVPALAGAVPASEIGVSMTSGQVTNLKAAMQAIDPNFKLHAWFGTFSTDNGGSDSLGHLNARVDLSNPTVRAAAIAYMMNTVNLGFDGVQDDTEDTTSITTIGQLDNDYVSFINEFAIAAHASGKTFAAYVPNNWTAFNLTRLPNMTQPDWIILAAGDAADPNWNARVTEFFSGTSKPVIFNPTAQGSAVMASQLSNLHALPYSSVAARIVGYSLYHYADLGPYWSVWENWRATHP